MPGLVCPDPKAITTQHLFPYLFSCLCGSHAHSNISLFVFNTFYFQLFMIDNCADDWRIAMTWQRMMQIGEEYTRRFPWQQAAYLYNSNNLSRKANLSESYILRRLILNEEVFRPLYLKCLYTYLYCGVLLGQSFIPIITGMELLVCAVHPIPGRFYFLWTTKLSNHGGKIGSQWVPVDVTLSLPMFLRYVTEIISLMT